MISNQIGSNTRASSPALCVSEGQRISVRNCNVTNPLTMGSKDHFLSIDHGTKNVHSGKTDTYIYQKHICTYEPRGHKADIDINYENLFY